MHRLLPISLGLMASFAVFAAPARAVDGTLTLYTSQPNADAQRTVDAFMAAHPGVEVEWVRDGTTKIMAKLRAEFEAGAPQPDVLLIADMVTMEGLEAEGRLMAYPEADVSAYDPALMDPQRHYFSHQADHDRHHLQHRREMVPASWSDLLKSRSRGPDRHAVAADLRAAPFTWRR
jgi:iron(III) transport system substrate-binding protein